MFLPFVLGPNKSTALQVAQGLEVAFSTIRGETEGGFNSWSKTDQFTNAFRYAALRKGFVYEVNLMPSQLQHGLACMIIACLRLMMELLHIDIDSDVKILEQRGKQFIGELGFVFRQIEAKSSPPHVRALKFHVEQPMLVAPQIAQALPHELPQLPESADFQQQRQLVDVDTDDEVASSCITV